MEEMKLLVVDDEDDFRITLINRLRKRNFDAQGADCGSAAIGLLEKERFDVIILDVKMPGMDGLETLQEIKRKKPLVEVIMLTGHASVEMGLQGMQLGAFEYIMKPADIDVLIGKIRRAYNKKVFHEQKVHETDEPAPDRGRAPDQ